MLLVPTGMKGYNEDEAAGQARGGTLHRASSF
jgi:hypothetical protein